MHKALMAAAVAALALRPALANAQSAPKSHGEHAKTVVEVAQASPDFKTLVTAIGAAGLVETLQGAGPFTVFAPNDAAFAKLPAGTIDALLKDKEKLASVLTYHVLPGRVMAADVLKAKPVQPVTVNGQKLDVVVKDGAVYVGGARVIATDITASNGVIHVIDTVLLPASKK